MMLSNKVYDFLKPVAQYVLPAVGTLYYAIARAWNLPYGEQVVGNIMLLDVFLGVLLGVSTSQYKKRQVNAMGYSYADMPMLPKTATEEEMPKWYMSKELYDNLYWVAQILLPALAALYFGAAQVNNLPYADQIVATITAIDAFLGVVLAVSTYELKKTAAKLNSASQE